MKTKLILFLLVAPGLLAAQEFRIPLSDFQDLSITLNMSNTHLEIDGSNREDILISSTDINKRHDERAEGLQTVGRYEDNTGLGLYYEKNSQGILIEKISIHDKRQYLIKVPSNVNVILKEMGWNKGSFIISGLSGNLSVKSNNSDIVMSGVSGIISAKSTSGHVSAVLGKNRQESERSFSSVSGIVEVVIPGDFKSNLKLKTISGYIVSDVKLSSTKKYKGSTLTRVGGVRMAEVAFNGGGALMKLSSVSGVVKLQVQK